MQALVVILLKWAVDLLQRVGRASEGKSNSSFDH